MFRNPKLYVDADTNSSIDKHAETFTTRRHARSLSIDRSLIKWIFGLGLLLLSSFAVQAQQANDTQMAAMSGIAMYLLNQESLAPIERPDGRAIEISLNRIINSGINVNNAEAVFFEFEDQNRPVEFCFDLTAQGSIFNGSVALEINGVSAPLFVGNDNCFTILAHLQRDENFILIRVTNPNTNVTLSRIELTPSNRNDELGLPTLTRGGWDEVAVRKVLRIFAFGGHATTEQIQAWADMDSQEAIQQMLNFSEHNARLSPVLAGDAYPDSQNIPGTLDSFLNYFSSSTANSPIPVEVSFSPGTVYRPRESFGIGRYRMDEGFQRMVVARGFNPFRQKIGFWETNYHLAVNLDAGVTGQMMVVYYDSIMQAHEQGLPYKDVIGVAAKSAAVATQYNHRFNQWFEGSQECACNDDFAREIHQLFYGIFGVDDPNHENGTIRETSKMLTDMRLVYIPSQGLPTEVDYQTEFHHRGDLTILGRTVSGRTAAEKIDSLMPISMQHPESLNNLPIMIIEVLADDNLSETSKRLLRSAWAQLGVNRRLLDFIHSYATSRIFHSSSQLKYATSFDRAFYTANKFNTENIEAFLGNDYYPHGSGVGKEIDAILVADSANDIFRPLHNVFGGQTSQQASDSALAFEGNYNTSVPAADYRVNRSFPVQCEACANGGEWRKDWSKVIPSNNGQYRASSVARWLWMHVVGNMDDYKTLEQAHLVSILGANHEEDPNDRRFLFWDLNYLMCIRDDRVANGLTSNNLRDLMAEDSWWRYCRHGDDGFVGDFSPTEKAAFNRVLSSQDITSTPHIDSLVRELLVSEVPLNSNDDFERQRANERVNAALAFIFATPFVFAEGQ